MKRAALAALSAVVLLAGCGGAGSAAQPRHKRAQIERNLSFVLSGRINARFAGRHIMEFVSFASDRPEFQAVTVATISTASPTPISKTRAVIIGVSLVSGYTGDGDYTILPRGEIGAPPSPGGPLPNLSVVRIETYPWPSNPYDPPIRRVDLGVPCRLHIQSEATVGNVRCAGRSGDPERQITLSMRWGP